MPVRRRWWPAALTVAGLAVWAVLATGVMTSPGGYRELSWPEWRRIAADPDARAGERIVVYGVVTQPGSGTRRDLVRAKVDGLDRSDPAGYMTPAELHGVDLPGADPTLAAGDTFRAEVAVDSSAADVLVLQVDRISVLARR